MALITLGCTITGMLLGMYLRPVLPDHHTRDESKDAVKTAAGMMATLVALIIGLLVSSAKSSFDSANATITQGGAKLLTLDRILAKYGPEASAIRVDLRQTVAVGIERIWPSESFHKPDLAGLEKATGMEDVFDKIRNLAPQTEAQQYLKSQALQLSADLMQSRWMVIEQSQNELPTVFLVLLAFWLTVLFTIFGLLAPRNVTSIMALSICAISMAGAIYLILELNRPLEGAIKVSSAPFQKALSLMGK